MHPYDLEQYAQAAKHLYINQDLCNTKNCRDFSQAKNGNSQKISEYNRNHMMHIIGLRCIFCAKYMTDLSTLRIHFNNNHGRSI